MAEWQGLPFKSSQPNRALIWDQKDEISIIQDLLDMSQKASINKRFVAAKIDEASDVFSWCLETISILNGSSSQNLGEGIVDFQIRLFDAISLLDDCYRLIKAEKDRLIAKKTTLKYRWFAHRMKTLSKYQNALREAMITGRTVGDGFAWFFYERDRDLISKHLEHESQPLLPPSVGRIGERSFLEKMRHLDGHIQLCHGITSFLRMGDASFVSLKNLRVSGIAEIKTIPVEDNSYNISGSLIFGNPDNVPNFSRISSGEQLNPVPLPYKMERRRQRQLSEISKSVSQTNNDSNRILTNENCSFGYAALEKATKGAPAYGTSYVKYGDGLLLVCLNVNPSAKFSQSLFGESRVNVERMTRDAPQETKKIVLENCEYNSIRMGTLGFGKENLITRSEGVPFSLWPLESSVMRKILLGQTMVLTIYNPAHFIQKLEAIGFEVELSDDYLPIKARKHINGRFVELGNLNTYLLYVQKYLLSEESVLELIEQTTTEFSEQFQEGNVQVQIVPQFYRWKFRGSQ